MTFGFFCPSNYYMGKFQVKAIQNYFQMIQLTDSSKEISPKNIQKNIAELQNVHESIEIENNDEKKAQKISENIN